LTSASRDERFLRARLIMERPAMPHYLCRLTSQRPSLSADVTPEERGLMTAHVEYWRSYVDVGRVVAMGSVADPAGVWRVAIMEADSAGEVEALQARDPLIVAQRGYAYHNYLMPDAALRPVEPRAAVSTISP
jgi:uncharacterized protein YciI